MNSLFQIHPYRRNGTWAFDDETRGLAGEPFVCGMNEIIDYWAGESGLALNNKSRAKITFAPMPFPGSQSSLSRLREEFGGNWYRDLVMGMEGWLCPALFKFFPVAPEVLFFRVDGV